MINEEWRDVKGYEGFYQVSNSGRVKSLLYHTRHGIFSRDKVLSPTNRDGYRLVGFQVKNSRRTLSVHRLVAEAFLPNFEGKKEVNHKDFNRSNNRVDNLEWCTPVENNHHTLNAGRANHARGEQTGSAKLTESQVKRIRLMKEITPNLLQKDIARMFGVDRTTIGLILSRKHWRQVVD